MSIAASLFMMMACKKSENTTTTTTTDSLSVTQNQTTDSTTFDLNSIPNATAEMGEFPYFTVPAWINEDSKYSGDISTDFGKLAVYTGNDFTEVEGPLFIKSYNMKDEKTGLKIDFNEAKFVKGFSQHFESLGAKKIWSGEIPKDKIDALNTRNNNKNYFFDHATSAQQNVVVYAVKNNGKPTFFTITSNNAYGAIYVVQNGELANDIGIIKSDQIQKDLSEKGKSVLHINFDTDKATLKSDGMDAVAEISKVLESDKALKLEINGYTDNTGNEQHNLQLSKDRAASVVTSLVAKGISKDRLSSNGFGSKNPIADNSSEDGKAQNRRVELVKK